MKIIAMLALICGLQTVNAKDVVFNDRNVCSIEGPVTMQSTHKAKLCLVDKVLVRRGRKYPIYLYLHSPGGSIYAGLKFIEFAKTVDNLHTVTSYAASMAAAIVEHLPGKRYISESGIVMFHRASGSVRGQMEDGELESRLSLWKKIIRKSEVTQAKRIGITLKEYKSRIVNEWWLYGEDAVKQNVTDKVVALKCSRRFAKKRVKKKIRSLFGTIKKEVSACPILN